MSNLSSRMRRRQEADGADQQELSLVSNSEQESSVDRLLGSQCDDSLPSPVLSPVEPLETLEADDILFRKNNVFLKYPRKGSLVTSSSLPRLTSLYSCSPSSSLGESGDSATDKGATSNLSGSSDSTQDSQVLIPGFLFITTRGSDFGVTLILNWAPNSSMCVPSPSSLTRGLIPCSSLSFTGPRSQSSSISTLSGSDKCGLNFPDLVPSPQRVLSQDHERGAEMMDIERPSCSSVSIDLGMMEVIRIFYRNSDNGIIVSGEMVISSKDRNFKVCTVTVV